MTLAAEGEAPHTQFIEDLGRIGMLQNIGFSPEAMAADAATPVAKRETEWEQRAAILRDQAIVAGASLRFRCRISPGFWLACRTRARLRGGLAGQRHP